MLALIAAVVAAAPIADAPITEVTVYSDRARVTRTARAPVSGPQQVRLPPLLQNVDPSSIRVEAQGAEVVRVDITPLQPDAIPVDEARKLLDQLNALDDQITQLSGQQAAWAQQASALMQISPQPPQGDPLKPQPKLDSSGWTVAMTFIGDNAAKAQAKSRELQQKVEELDRQRDALARKAQLLGGAQRRGGYDVVATLSGSGTATVKVTYLVGPARWYPGYDLQLQPEQGKVQVAFSGLVSQETGEDWSDAKLTLSTAVPATTLKVPELSSWKLGEKDRFIPTPRPKPIAWRPAPTAPPPLQSVDEAAVLRNRLLAAAANPDIELDGRVESGLIGGVTRGAGGQSGAMTGMSLSAPSGGMPPPPPRPSAPLTMQDRTYDKKEEMDYDDQAMPSAPTLEVENEYQVENIVTARPSRTMSFSGYAAESAPPASAFSLAPPAAWRPPTYSPDLPASLAGGYDLAWPSLQKETIPTGKGGRRVALFAQTWPVQVERKIFPALAKEAYLVAELQSPSPTPLPGGNAQLYVGADPAGTARLDLVAPGEKLTLPLGLDRAIKPVRNVELVTAEKGLIGKDDLSTYVTRIELSNPYSMPIQVKVFDQWPLTDDKNVEVKLLETKPWAIQDPVKGSLEWHLTLKPGTKTELSFTYSIRRPKNWRLHQN